MHKRITVPNTPAFARVVPLRTCGFRRELKLTQSLNSFLGSLVAQLPVSWETFSNGTRMKVKDVGSNGRFVKNKWRGPDRTTMVGETSPGTHKRIVCDGEQSAGADGTECGAEMIVLLSVQIVVGLQIVENGILACMGSHPP
jgi:hypothetical protein